MRALLARRPASEVRDGFDDRGPTENGLGRPPVGLAPRVTRQTFVNGVGMTGGTLYLSAAIQPLILWDTGFSDGSIQITLVTLGATGTSRILCRASNWIHVDSLLQEIWVAIGSGGYAIQRRVGASTTSLGTYATAAANGDVVRLAFYGPKLELFVNGTSRIAVTEGYCQGNTRHGLQLVADTTARLDALRILRT